MSTNIGQVLHQWARTDPARVAIVDAGHEMAEVTYGELDQRAERVAATLLARGLGPGDRVVVCTANGIDFVAAWFGALYAGCTTLPVSFLSTAHEIRFVIEHAHCKAIITDEQRHIVAKEACDLARGEPLLLDSTFPSRTEPHGGPAELDDAAWAMILYTSGTTGSAKGVCISHASLSSHTRALVRDTLRLTEEDRVLGTLPFTHSYGIRMTLLAPFIAGARCVFVPRFDATTTLELITAQGITWLPGVPTMFSAWADETTAPTPTSLRWCLSAGATLVEDVRLRAEKRLAAPVRQGYGLTEATFSAVNAPPDEAVPGSVGRAVEGVEIRIVDERGQSPPTGHSGEVVIRGDNVMAGYLDDRTATQHVMRGGWLHTGDVGTLDETGRLTIVDRIKDIIIRGGRNIYPTEVENVLADHPDITEVAVVGQADAYYGEEVVAVVVLAPGATLDVAELDRWVRQRLSPTKVPHRIALADALPQGNSGKVLKRLLRDQLEAGLLSSVSTR